MSLDGTKTMKRQIAVEVINDDPTGTCGLKLYQRKGKFTSRLIAANVDEGRVLDILTEKQQRQYEKGTWRFRVSAQALCEAFQWLP